MNENLKVALTYVSFLVSLGITFLQEIIITKVVLEIKSEQHKTKNSKFNHKWCYLIKIQSI